MEGNAAGGGDRFVMEETVELAVGAVACEAEDGLGLRWTASTKQTIFF